MDIRDKVIKGLECCAIDGGCGACPYDSFKDCPGSHPTPETLMKDALALLKEQEAVSVQKKQIEMVGLQTWDWVCGNCGQTVLFSAKYCPWCGRAVKWG